MTILRDRLRQSYAQAMRDRDTIKVATLRLVLAALRDRDIASRTEGGEVMISEEDITTLLRKMIRQRRESIELYERGGRIELAEREAAEIAVIEEFLPPLMTESEIKTAVDSIITNLGASGLKDIGRCMNELRACHANRMDFGLASAFVKERLSASDPSTSSLDS